MPHGTPPEDGFTFGDPDAATWGGVDAATWGPQREQRFRARLRRGDRSTVIEAVLSIDLTLVHSAVSSLQCEVPRIPGLADYKLGTLELLFGDDRLFRGRLTDYPGPGTSETATLGGPGPGYVLTRADLSVSYDGRDAHDAIREVWRTYTPFAATIYTPSSPTTLTDFAVEGTVLEVLQKLHTQAGMRWTVQHQNDSLTVESYVPDEQAKTQAWDAVEHDSSGQVLGYANKVTVYGGVDSQGQRVTASAKDQAEIDALASDFDDGEIPVRVDDRTLTTTADAQARADAELADRLDKDEFSGQLEIVPELVLPGYYYDIPEWEQDGVTPQLPVDTVSVREAAGEASVTLDVNTPDGPIDLLAQLETGQAQLNQPAPQSDSEKASQPTIIDSWEDQDFDEYLGQTDEWSVVAASTLSWDAPHGSYVAKNPAGSGYSKVYSTNGLSNYFSKGNVAKIDVRASAASGKIIVLFGVADSNHHYEAEVDFGHGAIRIERLDGAGTLTTLKEDATVSPPTDTTGTVTITWDDGLLGGADNDITVEYSEVSPSLTVNDSTHADNDGIGLLCADNSAADLFVDHYRLP